MRYTTYSTVKKIMGKAWLKKATPEQKAKLESLKQIDEFQKKMRDYCKTLTKEQKERIGKILSEEEN